MYPKPSHYDKLAGSERTISKLATLAREDTFTGSSHALVLAKRMGGIFRSSLPSEVVSDVYSASSGKHHYEHDAWKCNECGQSFLGYEEAAFCCCYSNEENHEENNEDEDNNQNTTPL